MIGASIAEQTPLDRLRAALLADPSAQDRLAAVVDRHDAIAALADYAAAAGIPLDQDTLTQQLLRDPLGFDRFTNAPANALHAPGPQWLPTGIGSDGSSYVVDWAHYGPRPLHESFFEEPLRRARNRPVSQAVQCRTPLAALIEDAELSRQPPPDGLIFHMSRCGSTLVAQVLAALSGSVVISEAPPLDAAVQIAQAQPELPLDLRAALVRNMAAALLSDRLGNTRRRFIKLDCWHALALPLLHAAFPDTPWLFLFRDPLPVMLSHEAMPGSQTVLGEKAQAYGIDDPFSLSRSEYAARALAAVCHAGTDHAGLGRGIFVDYAELPGAIAGRIFPHFGVAADALPPEALARVLSRDSKMPQADWDPSRQAPKQAASPVLVEIAERILAPAVQRLAALAERGASA
ncbi:MAG: hypothetical protein KGL44_02350 [Sphingomonadales bacterium]|nr:hypothetical protein [Sphingomonadales bacterium]